MKWYKNIFGQRDENGKRISRRQAEFNKKEAAYRFLDDSAGMTNEIYGGGLNARPGYSNDNKFLTTDEKADKYLNRKK